MKISRKNPRPRPRKTELTPGTTRRAKVAVRRGQTMIESDVRRRREFHVAPPKQAERRHSRPGSGWKRTRANMLPRSR